MITALIVVAIAVAAVVAVIMFAPDPTDLYNYDEWDDDDL